MKLTRQGVRDIDSEIASAGAAKRHNHRYVPHTFITREGSFNVQMRCYCGDVWRESEAERATREGHEERDRRDRAYDAIFGRQGWP